MFTSVLSSLTSLLPSNFIFSAYVPVLIFGFANGALLYGHDRTFRAFVRVQLATPLSLTTTVLFVASIVLAYVITSVSDFMRELLEGKHLPEWLADRLSAARARELAKARLKYDEARAVARTLDDARMRQIFERLRRASATGRSSNAAPFADAAAVRSPAVTTFDASVRAGTIAPDEMEAAIRAVEEKLAARPHERDDAMDREWQRLLDTLDYARDVANVDELDRLGERNARFGVVASPTSMGDVAASIDGYMTTRYGIDLDTMWSRLQGILQNVDDKAYEALIKAKTQLDFLVACAWLSAFTTVVWFVLLAALDTSWVTFLAVAVAGPALFALNYKLAVTNYGSYGMIVRACVDLNRFALLEKLHFRLPTSVREERRLWQTLRQLSSFGSGDVELSYETPPKKDA